MRVEDYKGEITSPLAAALTISEIDKALVIGDVMAELLPVLAAKVKAKGELPPRAEADARVIYKPLGGGGLDWETHSTLAGKVLSLPGVLADKKAYSIWDTQFEELLYA